MSPRSAAPARPAKCSWPCWCQAFPSRLRSCFPSSTFAVRFRLGFALGCASPMACFSWVNSKLGGFPTPFEPARHERSEEHTSELQSHLNLVCRLLLEKKKNKGNTTFFLPNVLRVSRT